MPRRETGFEPPGDAFALDPAYPSPEGAPPTPRAPQPVYDDLRDDGALVVIGWVAVCLFAWVFGIILCLVLTHV